MAVNIQSLSALTVLFGASFLAALALTPLVRTAALAFGQVAVPKDDRWHKKRTALLGGVSIFISSMGVWVTAAIFSGWESHGQPFLPIMAGAAAMFFLGLADDLFEMDPQHKLAGQMIISAVLVFLGFRLGWTDSATINLFLTILWLVGITNAFNLLDNMDGLAAGIAFIGGAFLALFLCTNTGVVESSCALIALFAYLGALLGFLVYNFNPASIFMGDAGSLYIGFMLASLTVVGGPTHIHGAGFVNLLSVIAIPILIVFIPILDTGFVSVMRKLFQRKISQGGRDHSSHRMVAIGLSERKSVLVLYGFSVASGGIALAIQYLSIWSSVILVVLYLLFVLLFWVYLGKVKVYSEASLVSQDSQSVFTPVLVEITYRRRLLEVVLDSAIIALAYYTAYVLRFEGSVGKDFPIFLKSLPIVLACQLLSFFLLGTYRGVWGKTGIRDVMGYGKAITAGTILSVLVLLGLYRFHGFSRAVFAIYWILMIVLVSLSRFSFRLLDEVFRRENGEGRPTIVYGAGTGGQMAVKEIETNRALGLNLIGFMDDDPNLKGKKVQGYSVFGGESDLEKVIRERGIQTIVISFKENGLRKQEQVKELCRQADLDVGVRRMRLVIE